MAEKKITGVQTENTIGKDSRVSRILKFIYRLFLVAAFIVIGKIIYIQLFYQPDPRFQKALTPRAKKEVTDPVRGSILAEDGRLLAVSVPMYQIYMDCTVRKAEFDEDGEKGAEENQEWLGKAKKLAAGLAGIYGDLSADQYYRLIARGRVNNRKYEKIGFPVDHATLQKLKELPLFNEASYRGGMIVKKIDTRRYPYGSLARRTIGSVRDNNDKNSLIGIEGKYDYALHGSEGVEWQQKSDAHGWIRDYDSTIVKVRDGYDIRTTIDIDIQDIVDYSIKKRMMENDNIEGGCAIVMDVKTGAIRAMVNLKKDEDGIPRESYNYAIGRAGAPGSVFKLATLMTLLEDGKIRSLEETVPTYKGIWKYQTGKTTTTFRDEYLQKWPDDKISILDGFKISSNNVFRMLACRYYEENPKRFTDKLSEYKFTEAFDFDLIGLARPVVVTPDQQAWSGTALPSIAIGYTVQETPLHIATFYNAVANKGKMMKPYLVEAFEQNGVVKEKFGPTILNGSICSRATADTLTRALMTVVQEGTGRGLKDARCQVAGKTGTAQMTFVTKVNGKDKVVYKDSQGNRMHQATFVGFFPADAPKYTAIVVLYSKLGKSNLYGAFSIPAFKNIVDEIYAIEDGIWGEEIKETGNMPRMEAKATNEADYGLGEVPEVGGMGLRDAIYTIENCGYRCSFEGTGLVAHQSPAAGSRKDKGTTVHIKLE